MENSLTVLQNFSLLELNTFGLDARAKFFLRVTDFSQLTAVFENPKLFSLPRFVLGGGSNTVFDGDFDGLVLHFVVKGIKRTGEDADFVYVSAAGGELWHDFVLWTLDNGFGGLENLSLIPGTVGAAPVQNVGAYGAEIKDFLHSLRVFDFYDGSRRVFTNRQCDFAYRDSFFKREARGRWVIEEVTFALPKKWAANTKYKELKDALASNSAPSAKDVSDAVISIRQRKLPDTRKVGNAGSFFKNPTVDEKEFARLKARFPDIAAFPLPGSRYRLAAGWLIDNAGWKGKKMGQAGVSPTQALVLINLGGAKSAELRALSDAVREDVAEKFGIILELEPVWVR